VRALTLPGAEPFVVRSSLKNQHKLFDLVFANDAYGPFDEQTIFNHVWPGELDVERHLMRKRLEGEVRKAKAALRIAGGPSAGPELWLRIEACRVLRDCD
jgi:hypothetical protein